eukprot:12885226-Heterocapsa_arctica.AAC.1
MGPRRTTVSRRAPPTWARSTAPRSTSRSTCPTTSSARGSAERQGKGHPPSRVAPSQHGYRD